MVRSHHDSLVARTPIIMLSALSSCDDKLKGYDLGADLYLPKPYKMKEVIVSAQQLIASFVNSPDPKQSARMTEIGHLSRK